MRAPLLIKRLAQHTLPRPIQLWPMHCALWLADRLGRRLGRRERTPRTLSGPARAGISVVIPQCDSPTMLVRALDSVYAAAAVCGEPLQVIVVAAGPGAAIDSPALIAYPGLELVQLSAPVGFSAAVELALQRARHDWTFLLSSDVEVHPDALRELAPLRNPDVFAIGPQIFHRNRHTGRREETGYIDWYADGRGIRIFHADPGGDLRLRPHLCVSRVAGLFQTQMLRRYAHATRCYDSLHYEDAEWGVSAWRDDLRVMFCPTAHVTHRPRADELPLPNEQETGRIIARNRVLFDARNYIIREGPRWVLDRIKELPESSQNELAVWYQFVGVFRQRLDAMRKNPVRDPPPLPSWVQKMGREKLPGDSYTFRFRERIEVPGQKPGDLRPIVLLITPFVAFPPQHGGARRIAGLLAELCKQFDVVLLTDEASLMDERSFAHFDGVHAVHLVQQEHARSNTGANIGERMRTHCHPSLVASLEALLSRYHPAIVQVEHAELAELVFCRGPGQRWVLGLHDALLETDFVDKEQARWFERQILARFDAVTVCSADDRSLVNHPLVVCVPNGSNPPALEYRPSYSSRLLFMGPFRYQRNYVGIQQFLCEVYPHVKADWPDTELVVLGGDGATRRTGQERAFKQPGVAVLDHREDVEQQLAECAMTINPLTNIRGSAVKVIESLTAGRICISTTEGARGLLEANHRGLVTADTVAQTMNPLLRLLKNPVERHNLEQPYAANLARHYWPNCAEVQIRLYYRLLGAEHIGRQLGSDGANKRPLSAT